VERPTLKPETVSDLNHTRAMLEAEADRLDGEYLKHHAGAAEAMRQRDLLDQEIDRISAVLGDRTIPYALARSYRRGMPAAPPPR
jgi:hypothetical protein